MYETIKYEVVDGVCTITLNRPEAYNAFNEALSTELKQAIKSASKDAAVRVVVLTGEGKAFCSGQDLKEVKASNGQRSLSESIHRRYNPIVRGLRNMPKPIICRLNGVAAGAGCSLALACDMIIAADTAKMIEVFINIGLVMDSGSSFFLPKLVGYNKAFELATMGTHIKAKDAEAMGIINKVVAPEELDGAVKQYTDYFAKAPTKAIALMKKMLNKAMTADMDSMLDYEAYAQEIAGRSDDYKEGVAAFLEKRPAEFQGR